MFPSGVEKVRGEIDSLRREINVFEWLLSNVGNPTFWTDVSSPPDSVAWRVSKTGHVVTRLYSLYERHVQELIRYYLEWLPKVHNFAELPENVQAKYRLGVARILGRLNIRRYQNVNLSAVVSNYHKALSDDDGYLLEPMAFLNYEQNLRMDVLADLLLGIGIGDCRSLLEGNGNIRRYLIDIRGEQTTLEAELKGFVDKRNDASHGLLDEPMGGTELLDLCAFCENLCIALHQTIVLKTANWFMKLGMLQRVGRVTEVLNKINVLIVPLESGKLSIGDKLLLLKNEKVSEGDVQSLQVDDQDLETVAANKTPYEVGVKIRGVPIKGADIYAFVRSS